MSGFHYARSAADFPTREQLAAQSGLDFMRGILAGKFSAPPIGETLQFRLIEVEEGRVVFEGQPNLGACNPMGGVHGGWFGTLLDSCMACAAMTRLPKGRGYTTLEYKINIIRGLGPDDAPVHAIGEARHVGRRTAVSEGRIIGARDGKLYATGATTCLVFDL